MSRRGRRRKAKITLASPGKGTTLADLGMKTPAAQAGAIIEDATWFDPDKGENVNPNGVKRARRLSVAETYERQGHLTKRQAEAAKTVLEAWEQNFRSPAPISGDRVDSSPKPDAHIAIQISRRSKYHQISKLIVTYRPYVLHVARDDKFLTSLAGYRKDGRYMARLQEGLDALADRIEGRRR